MPAQHRVVVAQDGTGDFRTIQQALDAVPAGNASEYVIFVRKGIYREVAVVDARKDFVSVIGENKDNTIVSFDNHAGTKLPNGDTLNTCNLITTSNPI